jgi:hypothetical protein
MTTPYEQGQYPSPPQGQYGPPPPAGYSQPPGTYVGDTYGPGGQLPPPGYPQPYTQTGPAGPIGPVHAPANGAGRPPTAAGTSNRRRFLLGAAAGVPLLGALGFLVSRLGGSASNQAAGGGGGGIDPGNYDPSSLPTAAANPNGISTSDVQALIANANKALKSRDEKSFVSAYAQGATATQAARMFSNIGKFDFDFLEYQLIGDGTREFGAGSDTTVGVDVALVHQISGVDVAHVAEWYRWELSKQGAGAPVVIESVTGSPSLSMGGARYVYYPHPWDSSADITVIKQGSAILCAENASDAAVMKAHAAEAVAAIQHNQDGWASGGGKRGQLAGALLMAASTRDKFYSWFSGAANSYGFEAGLTIPMITAEAMASGSPVVAFGGARITLDITTSYFTVDKGGDSAFSIFGHEDAHKLTFPLLTAEQPTVPLWVVEGWADFMGTRTVAGGVKNYFRVADIKAYAAGQTTTGAKWNGSLPTDDEIYSKADSMVGSASYGLAATAYYYIASIKGLPGAVAFLEANYQAAPANGGTGNGADNLASAFQSALGMDQGTFVAGWLAYIKQQIGVSPA